MPEAGHEASVYRRNARPVESAGTRRNRVRGLLLALGIASLGFIGWFPLPERSRAELRLARRPLPSHEPLTAVCSDWSGERVFAVGKHGAVIAPPDCRRRREGNTRAVGADTSRRRHQSACRSARRRASTARGFDASRFRGWRARRARQLSSRRMSSDLDYKPRKSACRRDCRRPGDRGRRRRHDSSRDGRRQPMACDVPWPR